MSVSNFDPAGLLETDLLLPPASADDSVSWSNNPAGAQLPGVSASWVEASVLEVEQSLKADTLDRFVAGEQSIFIAEAGDLAASAVRAVVEEPALTDLLTGERVAAASRPAYPGYLLRYVPGQTLEGRPAVAQWQAQMQQRGWTIEVDGLYGLQSERVARQFQAEKGLAIDGIVGAQTWEAAFDRRTITGTEDLDLVDSETVDIEPVFSTDENAYSGSTFSYRPFSPLSFNPQVQIFQERLKALGWQIEADGLFGERSAIATRNFQRQVNLDADGIVGPQTWAAAFADDAPAAPVEQNFNSPSLSGRINTVGLNLIKDFEGLRLNSYRDAVGVWTIGYGHTGTAGPGQRITNAQATALLREDVATFENAVTRAVRVPITENQFAALVSFTYNVGSGALNSSTLLRRLNAGDTLGAADEFLRWNRAGGQVLAGLTRRRVAERDLFLS